MILSEKDWLIALIQLSIFFSIALKSPLTANSIRIYINAHIYSDFQSYAIQPHRRLSQTVVTINSVTRNLVHCPARTSRWTQILTYKLRKLNDPLKNQSRRH